MEPHNKKEVGEIHSISDGYIEVKTPSGWQLEHRYIAEMMLSRELKSNEVVHHKNGDKTDNRWENLEVKTNSQHSLQHSEEENREIAVIRCPQCKEIFEREKNQTILCKPNQKATFCGQSCSARYYALGKEMSREKGLKHIEKVYER
jgi:phage FluMu protein Com